MCALDELFSLTPRNELYFSLVRGAVRQRFGSTKVERDDMLGAFIRHGLCQSDAEANAILQMSVKPSFRSFSGPHTLKRCSFFSVAGSDPIATALRAGVLYIATRPTVLSTLRSELQRHGLTPDRPITLIIPNAEARSLTYLAACVKEVLRIHPPIIGLLEKQVGPQADTLSDGRIIPSNTQIGVSMWAIQRDRDVYGEDADIFRPERWLAEMDVKRKKTMERTLDLVFGTGRFTCLGKEIAIAQCLKVFAEVSLFSELKELYGIFFFHLVNSRIDREKDESLVVAPSVLFILGVCPHDITILHSSSFLPLSPPPPSLLCQIPHSSRSCI